MDNGQLGIITIVIAGVATIIGAILIAVRNKVGDKKKKQMLVIVGTAFIASAGISLFINSVEVREILVAFAAVFAAIIAAISIYQSRQMRHDSIERESRDRKERLLNEITEWLKELEDRLYPKLAPITSGTEDTLRRIRSSSKIPPETWLLMENIDRTLAEMNAIRKGIKEAEYYQKLTSKLDEELSNLMEVIRNNLEQRRHLISESPEYPIDWSVEDKVAQLNKASTEDGVKLLAANANAIRKSILNAIDRAIELKTHLIQVP